MFTALGRSSSLIVAVVTLALFLITLPPWSPYLPRPGLDESWVAVLHYAYERGWHWGPEIAITFGPLGFLYTRLYDPFTFSTSLWIWTFLAGSAGLGLVAVSNKPGFLATMVACAGLVVALTAFTPDIFALCVPLLLVVVWCALKTSIRKIALAGLIVSSAILVQMKVSTLPLCFLSVLLIDIGTTLQRRIPLFTASLIVAVIAVWLLAGQDIVDLPVYVGNAMSIISGYDAAMQQFGSIYEIFTYLSCTSLAISIFAAILVKSHDATISSRLIIALMSAAFLLVSFKAGFTRHDMHSLIAWLSLLSGSSILLMLPWRHPDARWLRFVALMIPFFAAGAAALILYTTGAPPKNLIARLNFSSLVASISATYDDVMGTSPLKDKLADQLAKVATKSRLPTVDGTVDVIPSHQIELIAAGADYRPRPVFQGYAAYTPRLAELNRRFFESDRAPEYTIFGFDLMDDRYPSTIDGAVWPVLLARYEPIRLENSFLLLKRRNSDAPCVSSSPIVRKIRLGADTAVWSSPKAEAIWATIKIRETLLGKLVRFFWKPPVIQLLVTDPFERQSRFRLVSGNAEAGFFLSPTVSTSDDFLGLYVPDVPPSGHRVSRIEINLPDWAKRLYFPDVEVSLSEVILPRMREGIYAHGVLKDDFVARRTLEQRRLATVNRPLSFGQFQSPMPFVPGASVTISIPVEKGTLTDVQMTMVTFGKTPSSYAIKWKAELRTRDGSRELATGSLETALIRDWEPALFQLPESPIEQAGEMIMKIDIPPDATIRDAVGLALYSAADTSITTSIGNEAPQNLVPRIMLRYLHTGEYRNRTSEPR